MTNFEKFEEAFEARYGSLYDLMDRVDSNDMPFGGNLEKDDAEDISDSYDFTDDLLTRVIYFADFDVYVEFLGRNTSYVGEEWDSYKEVKPTTKTITTYE